MLAAIIPTLGMPELLAVLAILVLVFGASKLPQLGKGLGEGIRNFKKGLKGGDGAEGLAEGSEVKKET